MLLATSNTIHLARKIARIRREPLMKYTAKQFSDGEYYYRLNFDRKHASVSLIGNVTADPRSLFELMALAQACRDNGIAIKTLCVPYLGYSRQDRKLQKGEAVMIQVVADCLNKIRASRLVFVTLHSQEVRDVLHPHKEIGGVSWLADLVMDHKYDIVVAPDYGAKDRAKEAADGLPVIVMPKQRLKAGVVRREKKQYRVEGKRVLIVDDMIDTGGTIASAAEILHKQGAEVVDVAAVHGVFSRPSKKILATKAINQIMVSDTLPFRINKKIKIISIVYQLAKAL